MDEESKAPAQDPRPVTSTDSAPCSRLALPGGLPPGYPFQCSNPKSPLVPCLIPPVPRPPPSLDALLSQAPPQDSLKAPDSQTPKFRPGHPMGLPEDLTTQSRPEQAPRQARYSPRIGASWILRLLVRELTGCSWLGSSL